MARDIPEVIISQLSPVGGGHYTSRDLAFSPDGSRLYVSVGSQTNVQADMPEKPAAEIAAWEAERGTGATWGTEETEPPSWSSMSVTKRQAPGCLPMAFATASVLPSNRKQVMSGARSTNETSWVMTWYRIIQAAFPRAASLAGRGITWVITKTRVTLEPGQTWSARFASRMCHTQLTRLP